MTPIRVVLADDHTLVRAGLRALLHIMEGIDVVAEASDGHEALDLIGTYQPDVVLMDIAMPGLKGFPGVFSGFPPRYFRSVLQVFPG